MKAFSELYAAIDATTKTNEKIAAMARYFESAPPADAAWTLYFLSGRKPKQVVQSPKLAAWATQAAAIPDWLFRESYDAVGDLAETMALLVDLRFSIADFGLSGDSNRQSPIANHQSLSAWIEGVLLPLRGIDEASQRHAILEAWSVMDGWERFVWNKLITGEFRVGVSQRLVVRALAEVSGIEDSVIAHRLMGAWQPTPEFYAQLLAHDTRDANISRPYPFFLAYPLESRISATQSTESTESTEESNQKSASVAAVISVAKMQALLGDVNDWQAEWKWDGIRAQLIRRESQTFLWSRGEENITERFPELTALGALLPDGTVIDGEVLPFNDGQVLPFAVLQQRIGRKTLTRKVLTDAPVILMAYDLLELNGEDVRSRPLSWRRTKLEEIVVAANAPALRISLVVEARSWDHLVAAREDSRARNAEGLMLKRRSDAYGVGRIVGSWWKWKINPYTVDAVMIYAQRGHGKRASLYTDYTFGVWNDDHTQLVPFAKAYSGLTDAEIRQVDAFVRRNTVEKFGPVRTVTPALVFELAFEGIQRSSRHKSGVAVRFPRILRWRRDKAPAEADTIERVRALLELEG